jgi:hypothetical protein
MGRRLPIVLLAVAAFAAGCGGASSTSEAQKSANQILADAEQAAGAAQGVHVSGSIVDGGKRVVLALDLGQDDGKGSMAQGAARADVARVGNRAFMRASTEFWKTFATPAAALLLHDRWLTGTTAKPPFNAFTRFLSIRAVIGSELKKHGKLTKLGVRTYKGQKVVAIRDASSHDTLLVAASGTPYPVAALADGAVNFTDWDKPVNVTAPKGAVDISSFGG